MDIFLGRLKQKSGGVQFGYEKIIIHPKRNKRNFDFDYCIIVLSSTITFSKNIRKIRLAKKGPKTGTMVTI